MAQLTPGVVTAQDRMLQVLIESIERTGGIRRLVEHHGLGWLPELMNAACVVVLQEEEHLTIEEIEARLGLGRDKIEALLSTSAEAPETIDEAPVEVRDREDTSGRIGRASFLAVRAKDVRV